MSDLLIGNQCRVWQSYKNVFKTLAFLCLDSSSVDVYDIEKTIQKYRTQFLYNIKLDSRSKSIRDQLKSKSDGFKMNATPDRKQILSDDFIQETCILSDLFMLDELAAAELLLAGEDQLWRYPGHTRGLVAVLLYYDGQYHLLRSLKLMLQYVSGRKWSSGIPSELEGVISSFVKTLYGDGIFEKLVQSLDSLNPTTELERLCAQKAIGSQRHRKLLTKFIFDIRSTLAECIFTICCNSDIGVPAWKSLMQFVNKINLQSSLELPESFILCAVLYAIEVAPETAWDEIQCSPSLLKLAWAVQLRKRSSEDDDSVLHNAFSDSTIFDLGCKLVSHCDKDESWMARSLHQLICDVIELFPLRLRELRTSADETARTNAAYQREGLISEATSVFEGFLKFMGTLYYKWNEGADDFFTNESGCLHKFILLSLDSPPPNMYVTTLALLRGFSVKCGDRVLRLLVRLNAGYISLDHFASALHQYWTALRQDPRRMSPQEAHAATAVLQLLSVLCENHTPAALLLANNWRQLLIGLFACPVALEIKAACIDMLASFAVHSDLAPAISACISSSLIKLVIAELLDSESRAQCYPLTLSMINLLTHCASYLELDVVLNYVTNDVLGRLSANEDIRLSVFNFLIKALDSPSLSALILPKLCNDTPLSRRIQHLLSGDACENLLNFLSKAVEMNSSVVRIISGERLTSILSKLWDADMSVCSAISKLLAVSGVASPCHFNTATRHGIIEILENDFGECRDNILRWLCDQRNLNAITTNVQPGSILYALLISISTNTPSLGYELLAKLCQHKKSEQLLTILSDNDWIATQLEGLPNLAPRAGAGLMKLTALAVRLSNAPLHKILLYNENIMLQTLLIHSDIPEKPLPFEFNDPAILSEAVHFAQYIDRDGIQLIDIKALHKAIGNINDLKQILIHFTEENAYRTKIHWLLQHAEAWRALLTALLSTKMDFGELGCLITKLIELPSNQSLSASLLTLLMHAEPTETDVINLISRCQMLPNANFLGCLLICTQHFSNIKGWEGLLSVVLSGHDVKRLIAISLATELCYGANDFSFLRCLISSIRECNGRDQRQVIVAESQLSLLANLCCDQQRALNILPMMNNLTECSHVLLRSLLQLSLNILNALGGKHKQAASIALDIISYHIDTIQDICLSPEHNLDSIRKKALTASLISRATGCIEIESLPNMLVRRLRQFIFSLFVTYGNMDSWSKHLKFLDLKIEREAMKIALLDISSSALNYFKTHAVLVSLGAQLYPLFDSELDSHDENYFGMLLRYLSQSANFFCTVVDEERQFRQLFERDHYSKDEELQYATKNHMSMKEMFRTILTYKESQMITVYDQIEITCFVIMKHLDILKATLSSSEMDTLKSQLRISLPDSQIQQLIDIDKTVNEESLGQSFLSLIVRRVQISIQ